MKTYSFSDWNSVDLENPPSGAWFRESDSETVIGASTRSLPGVIIVLLIFPFFVTMCLLHIRDHVYCAPTIWTVSVLTLAGGGLIFGFLLSLGGITEVRLKGPEGTISNKIGKFHLTFRRRFNVYEVRAIRILQPCYEDPSHIQIYTAQGGGFRLGEWLTEPRKKFLATALRAAIIRVRKEAVRERA